MKKKVSLILIMSLLFISIAFCNCAMAASYKKMYLNKGIEIVYAEETQGFYDVSGKQVYPLSYEGTTYLPVRAITSMFNMSISWDSMNNTIYMSTEASDGKNKSASPIDEFIPGEASLISALVNDEIVIRFNGDVQSFSDVNGRTVYPISYEGTTYLPIRAISNLYQADIQWDGEKNQITIGKANLIETSGKVNEGIDTSDSKNFDYTKTYINNENHFAEINLEKLSSGKVMFYLKGVKISGSSYFVKYPVVFEDGVGYCEQVDLYIYLAGDKIVLETDTESYSILNGTYTQEGNELRTIVVSDMPENRWNGYFNKSETITLSLGQMSPNLVAISLVKYGANGIPTTAIARTIEKTDENTLYSSTGDMGKIERYKVVYLEDDIIEVTVDTGDVVIDKLFSGAYIRKDISPRELYLNLKSVIENISLGDGVTGCML